MSDTLFSQPIISTVTATTAPFSTVEVLVPTITTHSSNPQPTILAPP
jgi:hypothetical protein